MCKSPISTNKSPSVIMSVLDMCTGSGCILISLLKLREGVSGTGVDISEDALKVATKNRDKIGVDASLLQSDMFENVSGTYDVIVSNPPYIRTSVIEELEEEVKLHDPFIALDGKEDGLYFYRRIIDEGRAYLKQGGKLCFEIGHDQGEDVKNLMEFIRLMVVNGEAGIFWPQNREYVNTTEMARLIALAHGKKLAVIPGFGWALKLMSHVTALVDKAFGSLTYDMSLSEYREEYRIVGLEESIQETEGIS